MKSYLTFGRFYQIVGTCLAKVLKVSNMHIKKIVIEGFKSYGKRTVIGPFHPGHNVIVGSNGSGKSNFFAAIQFVLTDEYCGLSQNEREALLHQGSKSLAWSASVEIIFDNSDKRFPVDKSEVSVKRVIGSKRDQYRLNNQNSTKAELMSLMEVAGFSKSNPYYIVRQGKVNELAMTPVSRLMLLQEIAGVKVYEDKRTESQKILNETKQKILKIEEYLQIINEKLQTLNDETKELEAYKELEKRVRRIEFMVYDKDLSSAKNQLLSSTDKHNKIKEKQGKLQFTVKKLNDEIKSINHQLKRAQHEADTLEEENDNLSKELEKLMTEKELYILEKKEIEHAIELGNREEESIDKKLDELGKEIKDIQEKLTSKLPDYHKNVNEIDRTMMELESREQERQILYAKKGRAAQFQNKQERNEWIQDELTSIERQINEKTVHIENLERGLKDGHRKVSDFNDAIRRCLNEMEQQYSSIFDSMKNYSKSNQEREQHLAVMKDFQKQEKNLQNELTYLEEDLKKVEQDLNSLFGKAIFNGIKSVHKVLETFRERGDMAQELQQYYGLVIERFECEEPVYKAIEVTAGIRLFYHIVATAKFGSEILKEMNRQNLPGTVNFMPIDVIKPTHQQYPSLGYAIPIIRHLTYEPVYDIPIRFIFEKTLVCRDLMSGTEVANKYNFDCVTMEGDQVSSKGWLRGGHFGPSDSSMQKQHDRRTLLEKIRTVERQLADLNAEMERVDEKITSNIRQSQIDETKYNRARENYDKLTYDLKNVKEQLEIVENNNLLQNKNLQELKSDLKSLITLKDNLTKELDEDLDGQLKQADQIQMSTLNDSITKLKKKLKQLFEIRERLETEKNQLENKLSMHLNCTKNELERKKKDIALEREEMELKQNTNLYDLIEEKKINCERDLENNRIRLHKFNEQKTTIIEEKECLYSVLKLKQKKFEEKSKELEKLFCKIKILEQNMETARCRINELGYIPSNDDINREYRDLSREELYEKLSECRSNLKNYEHINKKALYQYEAFKDQKENLCKRKEELDRATRKIDELSSFLLAKKSEAVAFTFKQACKNFEEIFSKLVPGGKAQLVMEVDSSQSNDDTPSSTSSGMDRFIGVGTKVSFAEQTTAMVDYNQLSGGQKSLVALTLIFAIQRCDPAPFYLFDEIDQALDTAHRQAVAQMIRKLSSEAQFITTTFRPELLEHANEFYGVRFQNNLSSIVPVSREEALDFVHEDTE